MTCAGLAPQRAGHCLVNRRMRVPEACRAPGGGEVKKPPAIIPDEIDSVAPNDPLREEPQVRHSGDSLPVTLVQAAHVAPLRSGREMTLRRTLSPLRAARRGNRSC